MLKFYKIGQPESVINYIVSRIETTLDADKKTLWLLSGGSFIALEVEVARRLKNNPKLFNLSVSLVDERWGAPGHAASNWQQLQAAGFNIDGAKLIPVLKNLSFKETEGEFRKALENELSNADYLIALVGMGADGHILGVKPKSPAVDSSKLVIAYEWPDYKRITTTAELLKKADEVIVYAMGVEKRDQLKRLRKNLAVAEQPAQMLKLASDVVIFSDQLGESFKEGI